MMTLQEALKYIRESRPERFPLFDVALLCSFTPLHLKTFLTASLLQRLPERRVECGIGVYGDLLGALQTISDAPKTAAIVIEWADLDPRLGLRRAAGWLATGRDDIVNHASARLRALAAAITPLQRRMRVVVVAPTLPLPPFPITATIQLAPEAMALHSAVARFVTEIGRDPNVVILDPAALDRLSPVAERHDPRGEFAADFPYGKRHAAALAELMARLLAPQAPLKGIITDLDDTLWRGIVGDVGTDGVSWSLDGHGQGHALYQQTLASLAETGALLAIASKNQAEVAQAALKRPDMLIAADRFFPQEISWGPKSASVKAILDTWNVSADSVVFIDDSAMELAEVASAIPDLQFERFPTGDDAAIITLIRRLRDLFGKSAVTAEDHLRLDSVRQSALLRQAATTGLDALDAFLANAEATIAISFAKAGFDRRAFDLINKTNQFNLNGVRIEEAEWIKTLAAEDRFLATVSYTDRFGPLGKIGVIAGRMVGDALRVEHWVLSCRAFSRRVEHQTLRALLRRFPQARAINLAFHATGRNGPISDFLSMFARLEEGMTVIARERFEVLNLPCYHKVVLDD